MVGELQYPGLLPGKGAQAGGLLAGRLLPAKESNASGPRAVPALIFGHRFGINAGEYAYSADNPHPSRSAVR